MIDADLRAEAEKRIKQREGFRNYLLSWAGVTVLCIIIWALTSPGGYFWPIWPFLGMGLGALSMYFGNKRANKVTSPSAIDAEVAKIKSERS